MVAPPAHAGPSIGPDPFDFTYSTRYGNTNGTTRTVDYVVATSAYNTILTSRLNIYLPTSSGTIVTRFERSPFAIVPSVTTAYVMRTARPSVV